MGDGGLMEPALEVAIEMLLKKQKLRQKKKRPYTVSAV